MAGALVAHGGRLTLGCGHLGQLDVKTQSLGREGGSSAAMRALGGRQ
jgi:hypothetical protein